MAKPDYYDRVNPDLLEIMPSDARLVVEIGCGAGATGQQYKLQHPDCQYLGIESNPEAARIAEQRLDRVIIADVETLDEEPLDFVGQVDCLAYGDVLEHLVDCLGAILNSNNPIFNEDLAGNFIHPASSHPRELYITKTLFVLAHQWKLPQSPVLGTLSPRAPPHLT